jgi:hypothetical protein
MIACGHFAAATALDELAALQAEHVLEVRRFAQLPYREHGRVRARLARLLPDDLAEGVRDLFVEVRLGPSTATPSQPNTSRPVAHATWSRCERPATPRATVADENGRAMLDPADLGALVEVFRKLNAWRRDAS